MEVVAPIWAPIELFPLKSSFASRYTSYKLWHSCSSSKERKKLWRDIVYPVCLPGLHTASLTVVSRVALLWRGRSRRCLRSFFHPIVSGGGGRLGEARRWLFRSRSDLLLHSAHQAFYLALEGAEIGYEVHQSTDRSAVHWYCRIAGGLRDSRRGGAHIIGFFWRRRCKNLTIRSWHNHRT